VTDQNDNDNTDTNHEKPQPSFGNAFDSGLVRSILAVPIAVIVHLILAKVMDGWPLWQMILSFVFLTIPTVAWVFWPHRVIALLQSIRTLWRKVYSVVGAIALTVLIIIAGYWLTHRDAVKPRMRFTCDTWVGWGPLFIAKEKKFFGDTEFEIIPGHGSGEKRTFVYNGDADAIGETIDMLEYSSSASALAPGVILWAADRSNGADAVVASSAITSLPDLVEKRLGLEIGTPTHYMLLYHFEANKLPVDRVHIHDLLGPESTDMLLKNNLDAAGSWYPDLRLALQPPGNHILFSSKDMTGNYSIRDVVAVNPAFLNNHPDAVRDFFIGWCAAIRYMKTNPTDAYKIMADNLRISVSELEQELRTVEFYGYEENLELFRSDQQSQIVANLQNVRAVWQAAGFSRYVTPTERRVSSEIINKVTASDIEARLKSALRGH
jgi:NitT/TauT family transport system substrate-binding protein